MAFKQAEYLTNKKHYFQVYLLQIQAVKKIKKQFMIQVFRLPNVTRCIPFSLKN